jgi:hypothetical protein
LLGCQLLSQNPAGNQHKSAHNPNTGKSHVINKGFAN